MSSDLLDKLRGEMPDPTHVSRLREQLSRSLRPVKRLPSHGAMVWLLMLGFIALILVSSMPIGYFGFRVFTLGQKVLYYGAVFCGAWLLANAVAEQMIPASRRRVPLAVQIVFPMVVIAFVTPMVFPAFSTDEFVRRGVPCLRLGLLCAVPGAAVLAVTMGRGFITDRMGAAIAAGAFAGLVGIGVLAVHCPIQSSAHLLVWHLGVIVIAIMAGAVTGWYADRWG